MQIIFHLKIFHGYELWFLEMNLRKSVFVISDFSEYFPNVMIHLIVLNA